MRSIAISTIGSLASVALLVGCSSTELRDLPSEPAFNISEDRNDLDAFVWSEPVWLGPVVNSTARDWRPVLSSNGRSLYFHSNRPGLGGFDIWVARRVAPNCPWQVPVNLGPPINTAHDDGDAEFTPDGRVMFFASDEGHGGAGRGDIFVSRRADPNDDFAWEEPVNLGPEVNTADHEGSPAYVQSEAGGTLYFTRSSASVALATDMYKVRITHDGDVLGVASLVEELSAPVPTGPQAGTVRSDGRVLIFWSGTATAVRPGSVGQADLWVSTRRSVNDAWSTPRNIGRPVNSVFPDLSATLSQDGQTLLFTSAQARGGLGLQDMWMSTRGGIADHDNPEGDGQERRRCDGGLAELAP